MNSISGISEKLHKARIEQKLSVEDIAAATRINQKFLQEIDEGIMPEVGQTYVRAFIKAFAEQVGLDAAELLREEIKVPEPAPAPKAVTYSEPAQEEAVSAPPMKEPSGSPTGTSPQRQVKTLLLVTALIICGLAVMIFWLHKQRNDANVQENAFPYAAKEHEVKSSLSIKDSLKPEASLIKVIPRPDSLILDAVAAESVWVHIVIDDIQTKEYVLHPSYKMHWKAKNTFLLSVGNIGGISLTLNGKKFSPFGKNKKPAKNFPITWETYDQLQKESVKKEKG